LLKKGLLSVLGRLTNHDPFDHGELKLTLADLASQTYAIPNARRCHLNEKTTESWYYNWKQGGIDALAPRQRNDKGLSKIAYDVQEMLLQAKRENPRRSLNELIRLLEKEGVVAKDALNHPQRILSG
jgi:putative transposase